MISRTFASVFPRQSLGSLIFASVMSEMAMLRQQSSPEQGGDKKGHAQNTVENEASLYDAPPEETRKQYPNQQWEFDQGEGVLPFHSVGPEDVRFEIPPITAYEPVEQGAGCCQKG